MERLWMLESRIIVWKEKQCNLSNIIHFWFENQLRFLTLFRATLNERIANESWVATTNWIVIDNTASSILTANAWTWINTSCIYTRFITRTFWTCRTFWPTIWWPTNVIWLARTNCTIINFTTNTERSTRRWSTRILRFNVFNCNIQHYVSLLLNS